jgi:hypothetical protein
VRCWRSPRIVSALTITQNQSAALERLYVEGLPTQQHASEDVTFLTEEIVKRLDDGLYDDEQLHLTERLAGALVKQCELRHDALELAVQVLTAPQRGQLARLLAEDGIGERGAPERSARSARVRNR